MKLQIGFLLIIVTLTPPAMAADKIVYYPLSQVLDAAGNRALLGDDVSFYFASQNHGAVVKEFGSETANRKANGFLKNDQSACSRAALSALLELRKWAEKRGANAVIAIESDNRGAPFVSETEFVCRAGTLMNGVTLRGKLVTLSK